MTENVGYATLSVIPSFDGFGRKMEKGTSASLARAGTAGGSRFGSAFKSAARIGILGGVAAVAGAIKLGADAIGEAREAQQVARQTAAVLKSTGGAAKVSARDVGKLAGRLSYMAGVDDELVQQGENVLLTFKDIRNEAGKGNKIFDRATKVALNMSTALGTDLKGANIQLGKALNDPLKGITALTRVGVTFTDQQKEQIKTLVESGDKLAAQKLILKELGSEFGGSARSQADASDRLRVAFGNVQEKLGKGLLPIVQDFSRFLLREGVPAAEEFADWFNKEGIPAIKDLGKKLKPLAENLLPLAADGFGAIKDFAEDALPFAEGIVKAFDDMPGWVKKVLVGGVVGGTLAVKVGLPKLVGDSLFSKGATPARPLFVFVTNPGGVGGGGVPKAGPLGALGKLGLAGAVLSLGTVGVLKVNEIHRGGENTPKNGLAYLGRGGLNDMFGGLFGRDSEAKVDQFNRKLSETQATFAENKTAANDYFMFIKRGHPTEASTRFTVTGIDTAKAEIRSYLELLNQTATHIETRLDAAGGSGPTTPVAPSGRRGPTVIINGDVRPADSKEFMGEMQRRSISSAADGWG